MATLRRSVSVAMQDVFLFSDTVEGNIAYGNTDMSFDEVRACAKAADADGFINRMEEGYDTLIGERGVGLSGGQRQRIALAEGHCGPEGQLRAGCRSDYHFGRRKDH